MRFNRILPAGLTFVAFMQGCGVQSSSPELNAGVSKPEKIGILLASHGDIDDAATELEDYIKISFKKNVVIPLPF